MAVTLQITKKYLVLPINRRVSKKRLFFYENDVLLYDLNRKLDHIDPDFHAYVDVSFSSTCVTCPHIRLVKQALPSLILPQCCSRCIDSKFRHKNSRKHANECLQPINLPFFIE